MTISAKIIADSINVHTGARATTFELEYPRYIHAEIMTHRLFSRNAQSSRAVPVASTLDVNKDYVKPLIWGANKAGMSSTEQLEGIPLESAKNLWDCAAENAFIYSKSLAGVGLHKQWANRVTEPYSHIKVIITSTDSGYSNFFWLRIDPDAAQPEIVDLANKMFELYEENEPEILVENEWHLPYIKTGFKMQKLRHRIYLDAEGNELTEDEAIKISASCCAQVSYRKLNDTKEKAIEIYERLFSGPKPHLSPVEHQLKAFSYYRMDEWHKGITHLDYKGTYWSGNIEGFIQYRQVLAQSK